MLNSYSIARNKKIFFKLNRMNASAIQNILYYQLSIFNYQLLFLCSRHLFVLQHRCVALLYFLFYIERWFTNFKSQILKSFYDLKVVNSRNIHYYQLSIINCQLMLLRSQTFHRVCQCSFYTLVTHRKQCYYYSARGRCCKYPPRKFRVITIILQPRVHKIISHRRGNKE
jgi:hypothetical protein